MARRPNLMQRSKQVRLNVNSLIFTIYETGRQLHRKCLYLQVFVLHCSLHKVEQYCNDTDRVCCTERTISGKSEVLKLTFIFSRATHQLISFLNEFKKTAVTIC